MAFFCAGSSVGAKKKVASNSSKPAAPPPPSTAKGAVVTSNGRVINTHAHQTEQQQQQPLSTTIPHSNSVDLPNSRKMIVLQEYKPNDNRGLSVKRGESVQVKSTDGKNWLLVRNEWGKEGFVPSSHLVAPYSTTRSRKANPIRPVMSGSSIHDMDPTSKVVPMHQSTSAGRPRQPMTEHHRGGGDENHQRILSPNSQNTHHDLSNNNNNTLSQLSAGTYEQKYSPSSSSGVASLNGPSSPSFQSQTEHNSSASSLDHRCSPHEECSLSSLDDGTANHYASCENDSVMANGHHTSDDDDSILRNGSESSMQPPPPPVRPRGLPPHTPTNPEGMLVVEQQHIYSTIVSADDPPPPPVPPRPAKGFSASQGDYFENSTTNSSGNDTYSYPVDAVPTSEHFNYPRVRSLNDVRFREIRKEQQQQQQQQPNDLYTPVFQGKSSKPHSRQNGISSYRESGSSEGGSGSSSRRSSSKRSGSRHRMRNDRTATPMDDGYPQQVPECQLNHEDSTLPMLTSQTRISKFRKCLWGLFVVMEDFHGYDENDVSVRKGEHVSVWNQDDRDWYWVVKHTSNTSEEGFVPSLILREIVTQDAGQSSTVPVSESTKHVGVVTSKPHPPQVLGGGDFRPRVSSHESRGGGGGGVHRHPSFGSSGGSSGHHHHHHHRGRLNSDGSANLRMKTPSNASLEKSDLVEASPPSSPPPPYSEYDSASRRHFSLSQQTEPTQSGSSPYSTHMHRTRSQGHVTSYRTRPSPRGNVPAQLTIPNGVGDHVTRRRGGRGERIMSPASDQFSPRSPAVVDGGTLV